jgi:anti-sigma regulatory factor (Ser/Thr protein kinase)
MATTLQVTADARPESIRPLRNLVERLACDTGFSDSDAYAIKVCVGEALANAVLHAYPAGAPGPVNVTLREDGDELEISVEDQGEGVYEPRNAVGDLHLGLTLMTRLSSHCTFTAASHGTRLEMLFSHHRCEPAERRIHGRLRDLSVLP